MLNSIFDSTTTTEAVVALPCLLMALGASLALGLVISLVYMKTHRDKTPSQNFVLTLIMVPAVITIIILLVGSNVARAFSLAGAFSIIRFRSAPGDPKDIAYVLFSLAVGLSCGMGFLGYAAIVAVVLCGVMLILELVHFGRPVSSAKLLKITIPENLNYQNAFEDMLGEYTLTDRLIKVKTAELGSLYELVYEITMKNDNREKEFIDQLRCRNGNLNITLVLCAQPGEY